MGNDIAVTIFGVILVVVGFVVAIYTGTRMVAQVRLLEFLPAVQGYLIGMGIAVLFLVSGLLIVVFATRS